MVKNCEDMLILFDRIHERDRQTDGHCMTAKPRLYQCGNCRRGWGFNPHLISLDVFTP